MEDMKKIYEEISKKELKRLEIIHKIDDLEIATVDYVDIKKHKKIRKYLEKIERVLL